MDASVKWLDGMSFNGSADTGFNIRLDSDTAVGGADSGFRPIELMGISLAGCTAMDVISILRKKQQKVTGFQVLVHADRASEYPKVFTHIDILYKVTGENVDATALLRAIELSATKYCPAQAMLAKVVPMDLSYEIHSMNGSLEKSGKYTPAVPALS